MDESDKDVDVGELDRRTKLPKVTERQLKKFERYLDKDSDLAKFKRPCNHDGKSYLCNKIKNDDIKRNRRNLYDTSDKIQQEMKLCRMIAVCPVTRCRSVKNSPKSRTLAVKYYLRSKENEPLRVCLNFFTAALGVSKRRVDKLANVMNAGQAPKEHRAGDRLSQKLVAKTLKVREFIENLRGRESQNRSKSQRIYLSSKLNIAKLHEMYNSQCNENCQVTLTVFSKIFRKEYNIGFASPASDCCCLCTTLKHKIKAEKDVNKRKDAVTKYKLHKSRASALFDPEKLQAN